MTKVYKYLVYKKRSLLMVQYMVHMFTTGLKMVNIRLWWSLYREVSLFNVTRKKIT
jgi:hypothetical protein